MPSSPQLVLKPEAGQARLALYDFTGHSNADAEAYLKAHAAEDLARLAADRFPAGGRPSTPGRPPPGRGHRAPGRRGRRRPAVSSQDGGLLARVAALRTSADQGDWKAEAELATVLADSADLFWKLKALAALNRSQ